MFHLFTFKYPWLSLLKIMRKLCMFHMCTCHMLPMLIVNIFVWKVFVGIELKYDFRFWLVGDLFLIFHTLTIEKTNLDSLMSTLISYFSHVCSALTNNHFSCLDIYSIYIVYSCYTWLTFKYPSLSHMFPLLIVSHCVESFGWDWNHWIGSDFYFISE